MDAVAVTLWPIATALALLCSGFSTTSFLVFTRILASLEAESLIAVHRRARIRLAFRVTLHDRLVYFQRLAAPVAGLIFFIVAGLAAVGEQKTFAAIDELPAPCLA